MTTWNDLYTNLGPDAFFDDARLGPIQKADACLLGAIAQYIQPEVGVEFGCLDGHSASVLAKFCKKLICIDIDQARPGLCEVLKNNPNIQFTQASMHYWVPPDDVQNIGLLYIDASHNCEDSIIAYRNCETRLAETSVIVIHDTETWIDDRFKLPIIRDEAVHQERLFTKWLEKIGWHPVVFGCKTQFRHGMVIFQRNKGW